MTRVTLAAVVVVALAGSAAAQTYNAASDFDTSITATGSTVTAWSNPNGVWTYGSAASLSGAAFSTTGIASFVGGQNNFIKYWGVGGSEGLPAIYHNTDAQNIRSEGTTTYPANGIIIHPGNNLPLQYGVIRFTAPAAGTFSLAVTAAGASSSGASTDVHVLVNGVQPLAYPTIFVGSAGLNSGGSVTDGGLFLAANSTVDLFVGNGNGNISSDSTAVTFVLIPVPEPAALLVVAAVGLAAVRRRP